MYFLNISSLRRDLARGPLPAGETAIYVFLVFGLAIPVWYPAPQPSSFMLERAVDLAETVASVAIAAFGVRACYLANNGSAGEAFAERFVSLAWVVGVRLALTLIVPLALLVFALAQFQNPLVTKVALPIVGLGVQVAYFWRLTIQVGKVSALCEPAA